MEERTLEDMEGRQTTVYIYTRTGGLEYYKHFE